MPRIPVGEKFYLFHHQGLLDQYQPAADELIVLANGHRAGDWFDCKATLHFYALNGIPVSPRLVRFARHAVVPKQTFPPGGSNYAVTFCPDYKLTKLWTKGENEDLLEHFVEAHAADGPSYDVVTVRHRLLKANPRLSELVETLADRICAYRTIHCLFYDERT